MFIVWDWLGKKFFYYFNDNGWFVFGFEIKVILVLENILREICLDVVYDFFVY